MTEIEEGFYGAILKEDPRDYKLGGTSIVIPDAFNSETHKYNQLEFSQEFGSNLCTLYGPIGAISDLTGIEIKERKELCKLRTEMYDFDPPVGGYGVEGVNCVRNWWNRGNPDNQIRQFTLTFEELIEALDKGHRIVIGYRGNKVYNDDASDGVLDSVDIGKTVYGHFTSVKKIDGMYIVDNYEGVNKFNTYKIADFKAFIDSDITFPSYYLYLFATEAIDAEIYLLKEKYRVSNPEITFNEAKIKEYREFFNKK